VPRSSRREGTQWSAQAIGLIGHQRTCRHNTTPALPFVNALADKLLEAKVNSVLTEEIGIGIAPTGVTVSAVNGRITLAGTSSSGTMRRKVEKLAHRVAGVSQIENRIVSVPTRGRHTW
jgi:osmotically-inducible protein OsmY